MVELVLDLTDVGVQNSSKESFVNKLCVNQTVLMEVCVSVQGFVTVPWDTMAVSVKMHSVILLVKMVVTV